MSEFRLDQFIPIILLITLVVVWGVKTKKALTKEVEQYNKKHNKNFKTWKELEKYRKTKEVEQYNKEHNKNFKTWEELEKYRKIKRENEEKAKEEKKRREKLERTPRANYESSSNLGASLKRLKKMYNDGHLSKVEFEKAKNKLLK